MYALRSCITTPLLTLLLLGLLTSCRHPNKSSDIQAHETLVHVQALLQSDSFPENDSLLTPSIRFFTHTASTPCWPRHTTCRAKSYATTTSCCGPPMPI